MRRLLLALALLAPLASCSIFVMEPTGFRTGRQPTCTRSIKWGVVDALISIGASGTGWLIYADDPDRISARETASLGLGVISVSFLVSTWTGLVKVVACH